MIPPPPLAADWLARDTATTFALDDRGRILGENDPDRSPGPRLFMAAGPGGVVAHARWDLPDEIAERLLARARSTPIWTDDGDPGPLEGLVELLSQDGPPPTVSRALMWRMPHDLSHAADAPIISSHTPRGDELLTRLERNGVPRALFEAGFIGVGDFWAPWCVLLEGEEIAAMAFAARLSAAGAAVGVYTFPGFRGRGLASAVTAAWTRHPVLRERPLFYSALAANISSHRVTQRLGLPRLGVSLRIS